ncbi:MAG: hypothetical protein JRI23_07445 [Deltaproteobacteria bacterium]|jgi:hypothetical protein|nr:hypothetical protein [Deltaproteobacteria bacterium]MBW2531428.1 hypothetical protein [Deltaproteobacteria bacterium]
MWVDRRDGLRLRPSAIALLASLVATFGCSDDEAAAPTTTAAGGVGGAGGAGGMGGHGATTGSGGAGGGGGGAPSVKWHPGHYLMWTMGTSDASTQSFRFTRYDQIADSTAVLGAVVFVKWKQIEPSQGVYDFSTVHQELDKLEGLTVPKRLVVRMTPQYYGNDPAQSCALGSSDYYPDYVISADGCAQTSNQSIAAFWKPEITDHYIRVMLALAAELDGEPYFENIVLTRETSFGQPRPADYTASAYIAQLERLAAEVKAGWTRTNVTMNINWVDGGQTATNDLIAYMRTIGVGVGGPDVAPTCINDDCSQGFADVQGIWSYNTVIGNSTGGGTAIAGIVPLNMGIEGSELGLNTVGQEGGYTPAELFAFCDSLLGCSSMYWLRNEWWGTAEQQWDTGILPFIEANPTLSNAACPSTYTAGCDGS